MPLEGIIIFAPNISACCVRGESEATMFDFDNKVPVNSVVEISIDPNKTTAFITFSKPENGGMDVTVEKIMQILEDNFVSHGIQEDTIKMAVEQKRYNENICAAKWTEPQNGIDGVVQYYFNKDKHIAPIEDEQGNVDYKNLGLINNIMVGTPIAEISLPTEGVPGTDITGATVPQKVGVPARYNVGAGTQLMNNDTQIVAAVSGNLIFKNGAFVVEEKIVINGDVDVSSGNIDFIGDITIKGGVFEGFRVASKRSITIMGLVAKAEIVADGDILIKGGAVNSKIVSKANVKIGFCENTNITAEGNVESPSFIGGEVFASEKIIASGKGVLVGGKYTALNGIEASVIGSENYTKTIVTLGNNAVLNEEREKLEKENASLEEQVDQLGKILITLHEYTKKGKLSPERERMQTDARRSRIRLQNQVRANNRRIAEIDELLKLTQNLFVTVKRILYPGVTLRINSSVLKVNAVENRVKAMVQGGDIVLFHQ